jgi:hypothetical protein
MLLINANQYFKTSFQAYKLVVLNLRMARQGLTEQDISKSPPLQAYVNHGFWRVKCECGGCEFAWDEELFMCQSCWNGGHKHQFRKAVFPKERKEIEELLSIRPLQNRNWYAGETLAQLKAENKEHKEELL